MNGKFEEKLAQLAFGDVTPEEAARIEAQVGKDPAAQQALAEFRDMRAGLRGLAEVPEHQLSNERLRDAILARGLQPEPVQEPKKGFGPGWLWMPVAALALGFGIVTLRPRATVDVPTVVLNDKQKDTADFNISMPEPRDLFRSQTFPSLTPSNDAPKVASTGTASKPPPMLASNKRSGSEGRSARKPRRRNPMFTDDYQPLRVKGWKAPETLVADNKPAPTAKLPVDTTPKETIVARNDSAPIVLIDTNPDAATGAPTATEVGTASNVLIGG